MEEKTQELFDLEGLYFLLNEIRESVEKMEKKNIETFEKIMEGFHCIDKSFKMLSGAIIALSNDLGTATGQISEDPWEL